METATVDHPEAAVLEYRTYREWNARGRRIISGSHPSHYLVEPETKAAMPAFSEDQTVPTNHAPPDTSDWDLWPVETVKANRQKRGRRKPTVVIRSDGAVWVGDDPILNRAMKTAGWIWADWHWHPNPSGYVPISAVVEQLRASGSYLIIDERPADD